MKRRLAAVAVALLALRPGPVPVAAAASHANGPERPWLVVSDIHYQPYGRSGRSKRPATYGSDTNPVLFNDFLAELVRTEPDPPVVVVAGDFLGHGFPPSRAAATMAYLARRFDDIYPHAQFVIVLGNNDSSCGDYEPAIDAPFLRATARAWAPLVDRNGAAPDFVRTFAHDGGYTARLPRPGLRAVVVDDVFDALRYRNACGTGNAPRNELSDFDRRLGTPPPGTRTWIVTHVPPGIDAFSTAHLAHRLVVVPFMRPNAQAAFLSAIDAPAHRVALVIAGHTHHFAFRLSAADRPADDVPILVAPSVSPVFRNAPGFLTLDVAADGTVRDATETSFLNGRWKRVGDLAEQGVRTVTAPELLAYQHRLARRADARATYVRLYGGGAPPEIDDRTWPVYFCAATALDPPAFDACTGAGGSGYVTRRGFDTLALFGAAAALMLAGVASIRAFRRRRVRRS